MTTLLEMSSKWFSETVAQEIRKDIDQWLGSKKKLAEEKWPWELLQNAFDAAITSEQRDLDIEFLQAEDGIFRFSHNGNRGIFINKEFFRLLTRGTTKVDPDEDLEGRFGEGFVVTHILSEVVDVTGTIENDRGFRSFNITMDRLGEWEDISKKIASCIEKIDTLNSYTDEPIGKAIFEYHCSKSKTSESAIEIGFCRLQELLPYVMAIMFVRRNIKVQLRIGSLKSISTYSLSDNESKKLDEKVWKIAIRKENPAEVVTTFLLISQTTVTDHYLALQISEESNVLLPPSGKENSIPKLFSNFPLFRTSDLPLPCVIFGKLGQQDWHVDKDRCDLNYENETTVMKLKQDVMAIPDLWKWLNEKATLNRHRLLYSRKIDNRDGSDKWVQILKELTGKLILLQAVDVTYGEPRKATDVVIPSIPDSVVETYKENLLMNTWKIENFRGNYIPKKDIAFDWFEIAKGWKSFNVGLVMHTLENIIKVVSSHSNINNFLTDKAQFPKIDTKEKSLEFLKLTILSVLDYVDTIKSTPSYIKDAKIYCDQKGTLKKIEPTLIIDSGISESLKDIAEQLGYSIREKLLAKELTTPDTERWFTKELQLRKWTDIETISEIFDYLRNFDKHLTERKKDGKLIEYKKGLVDFTRFLAQSVDKLQVIGDTINMQEFPFIWADDEVKTIKNRQLDRCYLPLSMIDISFQQYVELFPSSTRLSNVYATNDPNIDKAMAQFLKKRNIAVEEPFYERQRKLDKDELNTLSTIISTEQHSLQEVTLKAIPGFQQLLSSIGRGGPTPSPESFLKFVLNFLATKDDSWRIAKHVISKCTWPGHKECGVQIYASEWLLMLKKIKWVPIEGGVLSTPNGNNLEEIVAKISDTFSSELAMELLIILGCDELNISVLYLGGSDGSLRPTIRRKLAKIASFAKSVDDLSKIEERVRGYFETCKIVKRNQFLGEMAQRIVAQAFRNQGLMVKDDEIRNLKGHDFEVVTGREPDEEDTLLLVRNVWVEVKETNQNEVRMTKPQVDAAVDRKGGYALCVLDLRDEEELRNSIIEAAESIDLETDIGESAFGKFAEEMVTKIIPHIRISQIGNNIEPKLKAYETAILDEGSGVRIEYGKQLHFLISYSIWNDEAKTLPELIQGINTI